MANTLCFIQAPGSSTEEQAHYFAERNWSVELVDPAAPDALDKIVDFEPLASVFSLEADSGDTIPVAGALLEDERAERPLIVFVGGSAEQVEAAKQTVPFGVYVSSGELSWVIKRLVFND